MPFWRLSPRRQPTSDTQRAILDAAEEIFARHGLQGTRVREIADAAVVNVATLYNYYKNKEALYEAVLDQGMQPVTEAIKVLKYSGSELVVVDPQYSATSIHADQWLPLDTGTDAALALATALQLGSYVQDTRVGIRATDQATV